MLTPPKPLALISDSILPFFNLFVKFYDPLVICQISFKTSRYTQNTVPSTGEFILFTVNENFPQKAVKL